MCFVRSLLLTFISFTLLPAMLLAIDPVRPGDQIEVKVLNKWYPGEVLAYENGTAMVRYTFAGETQGKFTLDQMRFPNNEGTWMIWRDSSGKFKITARLLNRSETHVTLLKEDGEIIDVPIASLADSIQRQLGKIAKAEKDFVDSAFVRIGDQVEWKWFSTWYPAVVKELRTDGALIDYNNGFGMREYEAKYADLRYPNGEGPWADWKDVTGKHKIKARYLTHDEKHVELLLEGGKQIRFERSKLDPNIAADLAKRPIFARRAKVSAFDVSGVDFENIPSWIEFGSDARKYTANTFRDISAKPRPKLSDVDFSFTINRSGIAKPALFVEGEKPLIAVVLSPKEATSEEPITLFWIDLESRKVQTGPNFLPGEVIIAYSSRQQRLLTAEGYDLRGSATRFSCYRLKPGAMFAEAEFRWEVPNLKFYSQLQDSKAQFIGSDQVLVGYGGTITLWDLASKSARYVVPSSYSEFNLSPDESYFFTNQFSRSVVVETQTGKPVTEFEDPQAVFCDDGKHVFGSGRFRTKLIPLDSPSNVVQCSSSSWEDKSMTTHPSVIDSKWLFTGNKLFDLQNGRLVWSYNTSDIKVLMQESIGNSFVVVGSNANSDAATTIRVSINRIPSETTLRSYTELTDEQLFAVRKGIKVRIDPSVTEPKILTGVKRAAESAGWILSDSADITIKASAMRGQTQTPTYNISRFGSGSTSSETKVSVTVTPWIQSVSLEFNGQSIWSIGSGGVPGFIMTREKESPEAEVRKCEQPRYDLFESLVFPDKVMYPKWRNGFGTTVVGKTNTTEMPVIP